MKQYRYLIFFLLVSFTSITCRKENTTPIPQVGVDVYIYLSNPTYIKLTVVGGWTYIDNAGVRGILVYRKSNTEFMAYDRNCTYQPEDPCAKIVVNDSNIIAVDTCCHSEFLLTDGSVLKAPASIPLKAYQNTFDGNILHIYN